jgi:hypothetical protein
MLKKDYTLEDYLAAETAIRSRWMRFGESRHRMLKDSHGRVVIVKATLTPGDRWRVRCVLPLAEGGIEYALGKSEKLLYDAAVSALEVFADGRESLDCELIGEKIVSADELRRSLSLLRYVGSRKLGDDL